MPGRTGMAVGVIGMGTWRTFDVPVEASEEVAERTEITSEAIGHGVNFFDSSPMYGSAEAVLAKTLEGRRDSVLVATKVWTASPEEGRRQVEYALSLYGGRVEVYQIHNLVAWRQHLPLLQALREEGKVGAVGITHYARSAFGELRRIMEREDVQAIQLPYNAVDVEAGSVLLPVAEERGVGVIVMSPLGTGELVRNAPPANEMRELESFGVRTWAQVLLKWVVSDPRVTVVIPATSRKGRMTENAAAGEPPFFGEEQRERVTWLARRYSSS